VVKLEYPTTTIQNYMKALFRIAETLEENEAAVISQIAEGADQEAKKIEAAYSELFQASHPNRKHFEKEGWPSDGDETLPNRTEPKLNTPFPLRRGPEAGKVNLNLCPPGPANEAPPPGGLTISESNSATCKSEPEF